MARLLMFLGAGLIISAVVLLASSFQDIHTSLFGRLVERLYCQTDEQVVQVEGPTVYDTANNAYSNSINFYCENGAGEQRDISGNVVGAMIGSFVLPLLMGLAFLILGGRLLVKNRTEKFSGFFNATDQVDPLLTVKQLARQTHTPVEVLNTLESIKEQQASNKTGGGNGEPEDLASKLAQLDEALDKNLISQREYDQTRQALLDRFKQ